MKYWLTFASVLLFICVTSATNPESRQGKRFPFRDIGLDFEKNVKPRREPRREFNSTSTLKSVKVGKHLHGNNVDDSPVLRVERFQTRLNHFSTDDQRTVEFVRIII